MPRSGGKINEAIFVDTARHVIRDRQKGRAQPRFENVIGLAIGSNQDFQGDAAIAPRIPKNPTISRYSSTDIPEISSNSKQIVSIRAFFRVKNLRSVRELAKLRHYSSIVFFLAYFIRDVYICDEHWMIIYFFILLSCNFYWLQFGK